MLKIINAAAIIALFFVNLCHADINPQTGSYRREFTDFPFLHRIYDSRNLYSGYFGFGWCSNLETRIEKNWNSDIILHHCLFPTPLLIRKITKTKWQGADSLTATKHGLTIQINNLSLGHLSFSEKSGKLLTANGYHFIYKPNGNIDVLQGLRLQFKIAINKDTGKITQIKPQRGSTIRYTYQFDDLVSTSQSTTRNKIIYTYDDFHNLMSIQSVKRQTSQLLETMTYDQINDRLTSYKNKQGVDLEVTYQDYGNGAYETQVTNRYNLKEKKVFRYPRAFNIHQRLGGNND